MGRRLSDPDAWKARAPGLGSCFHRALARWAQLQQADSTHGFRVAIGIVRKGTAGTRNVHAWLERGDAVVSAVNGQEWARGLYYIAVDIEPGSVRLVNPRRIVRAGRIDRSSVAALLAEWGGRYRVTAEGGVIAA